MSKSDLFQGSEKETITQDNKQESTKPEVQKSINDYHTFRNLSKEFQDTNSTPAKVSEVNSEFAPQNGEKILAVYNAPDGSDKKYTGNPNEKEDFYENVKSFKIMHNTSQNSSNLAASVFQNPKTDSPSIDTDLPLKSSHPELNSILKESSKQIDKINKMLEEHKRKKALRHLNDSIDRIDTSGASITEDYIREMKAKLNQNANRPAPLEHIEDYSAKKPAPSVHAATVMNGSVFPSSTKTYSLSQTNTPKSKRAPGTDIKIPIQDQSPKISKPSARLQTEFETEATKNGSESARNVRVPTNQSTSVKKNSVDRTSVASPKIPVEDRLLQHNQQRENRLKQLSQERSQEEMKELKSAPTISKKSKQIVQNSERLQRERQELESFIRKDKTQIMIIEEQEELLKSEISNLIVESKANETNKALDKDEVVITEGNQAGPIDEIIIVKDTAEEETKKKSSPPASIYSRMRKKDERTYSEIFLQKRSRSPTQENSKFTTPHNMSRQTEERPVHSPKTAEILKKVSTPKHILLQFELPNSEPKLKKSSQSTPSLKQDGLPTKSLNKQIEKLVGNPKNGDKQEKAPEPKPVQQDGFDMVQKLQIMSKNLKQIKNNNMIRNKSRQKKVEEPPVVESPPKSVRVLGSERLSNQSLMESVKLRKNKFFEIIDNSLSIKDKEEVLRDLGENQLTQADGYEIDGGLKKWDEIPIYDRQALWLNARNSKVDSLGTKLVEKELQECTFQPVLITKFASPKNFTPGGTPNKSLISGDSRFTSGGRSKSRSFSRERRNVQGSYHKWHELRKNWETEIRPQEEVGNGIEKK